MDERQKVIRMIRGCLDSYKGQMTPAQLDKDYRCLVGEKIPFQKFGYQYLEKFLSSFPELTLQPIGNTCLIYLQPSESTKHIVNMVKAQKGTSRKASQQLPPRRQASSWKGFPRKPFNRGYPQINTSRNRLKEINNNDRSRVPQRFGNGNMQNRYPGINPHPTNSNSPLPLLSQYNTKSFNPPKKDEMNYSGIGSSDIYTTLPTAQRYGNDNVNSKKSQEKKNEMNYSGIGSSDINKTLPTAQRYVNDNVNSKKSQPKKDEMNYSGIGSSDLYKTLPTAQKYGNDNGNSKKSQPKKDEMNYSGIGSSDIYTTLPTAQRYGNDNVNSKKSQEKKNEMNYSGIGSSDINKTLPTAQRYVNDNVNSKKSQPKKGEMNYSGIGSSDLYTTLPTAQRYGNENVNSKKSQPKKDEINYSTNASSNAIPTAQRIENGNPNIKKPPINKNPPTLKIHVTKSQNHQPIQMKQQVSQHQNYQPIQKQQVSPVQISPPRSRNRPTLYSRSLMAYQNIYETNTGPQKITITVNSNLPKPKQKVPKPITIGPPAPPNIGQYTNLLAKFIKENNLPDPVYKLVSHKPKKQAKFFCGTVYIGSKQFVSLPDGGKTGAEAQEIVAKKALTQLQQEITNSQFPETRADSNLLSTRILELVSSHSNGFWSTEIPIAYEKHFKETLPKNWFNLIQNSPLLNFEMITHQEKFIISARESGDGPSVETPPEDDETMNAITESIIVPKSPAWDVFITCADSTEEVWLRLIGPDYSDEYNNMSTDMEMYYMKPKPSKSNTLYVGGLYALIQDGNWHRVRLTEMSDGENNDCLVFFIDHGDEERTKIENLYPLESRFKRLPPQAIPCHLSGLEEFRNESYVPSILVQHIIGRSLVAEVISSPNQDGNEDVTFGMILYDTSTDDDINLNDVITDEIIKHLKEPQLEEDNIQEIFLSHVSPEGIVYLQFRSDIQSYVEKLLNQFGDDSQLLTNAICEILPLPLTEQPLYLLLPDSETGISFKRCQILEPESEKVKIFLVDEGQTLAVPATLLIPLDQFSSPLNKIPKQAIGASLYQVAKFDESIIERVNELCPTNEPVLVRCVARNKNRRDALPMIELFKRIEPDRFLVSINADLANFKALETLNDMAVDKATERKQRIQRLSSLNLNLDSINTNSTTSSNPTMTSNFFIAAGKRYGLPVPEMPTRGNLIDVYISIVASPSNFIVQPLVYQPQLRSLVTDMNTTYEKLLTQKAATETIQDGKVYAVKNTDDIWYRASVITILNSSASVYFCDFGDVAILSLKSFMPLLPQFKELPFQAIKACLAGVEPKHKDWSVADCLTFKEIVHEKQFVAKVINITPSPLINDEAIFCLELIDTSGTSDIYIHQKLIDQERARPLPPIND